LQNVIKKLKKEKYKLAVASNACKATVEKLLETNGFIKFIDFYLSNEDVKNPKPNSEIYLKCMIEAGVNPKECLILEDSHIGRKAAIDSGGFLCPIKNPKDVTYKKIKTYLNNIHSLKIKPKWQGGQMNVIIPMSGDGKRFKQAGYDLPKPLIEIDKKPMIQLVIENLNIDARYIFIVKKEHYEKYNLKYLLNVLCPNCEIIQTESTTGGAACSCLLATEFINNKNNLLIANSDQYLEWDSNEFIYSSLDDEIDGSISTFESNLNKWSYVKIDQNGFATEVAEKQVISNLATTGIYFWKHGCDFVKFANEMILKNKKTNNEFYVCPVFNEAINSGKKIKTFPVKKMWGLGTPEDLEIFTACKLEQTDQTSHNFD
jgi:dTDP-glucose pyrophosphorylase